MSKADTDDFNLSSSIPSTIYFLGIFPIVPEHKIPRNLLPMLRMAYGIFMPV